VFLPSATAAFYPAKPSRWNPEVLPIPPKRCCARHRLTQIQARYPTVENSKTKKNLPADHPDEADEEERMIGHKKHEESQTS
jgi:hypothetical protein